MHTVVRKLGNSAGVLIPRSALAELGLAAGDTVTLTLEHGTLVLTPIRRPSRTGWAEASRTIAEVGDDALAWPEFANQDDDALQW